MKLTEIQTRAVNKIVSLYLDKSSKEIQFVAPTGSGKTFMIANVISDILKHNQNNKIVFIIFTISDAQLPKQFKNKLIQYQDYLDFKFNVDHKESPSTTKIKNDNDYYIKWNNKDVLIFGTSSFGKNTIFTQMQRFRDMILELNEQGYEIIYIRDEAHRGDTKIVNGKEIDNEQKFVEKYASYVIKMTATPDAKTNVKQIMISEKELNDVNEDTYLLKDKAHLNVGFKDSEIDNDDIILRTAIREFKIQKKKYLDESLKINLQINPCMLIQVDSKNQANETIEDNDHRINEITKILDENNLSWVIYFASRKESSLKESQNKKDINLNEIAKNNSAIDVVIFKVGPATGWDIPRACMLVQLRKISSTKLNAQTVGRIKRNPDPSLKNNELFRQYWIYSAHQEKTREIHKYKLKEEFKEVSFRAIKAANKDTNAQYRNEYIYFIKNKLKPCLDENEENIIRNLKTEFHYSNKTITVSEEVFSVDKGENKPTYKYKLFNLLDMKKYIIKQREKYKHWIHNIDSDINHYYLNIKNQIHLFDLTKEQFEVIFYRDLMEEINNLRKFFFARKNDNYYLDHQNYYLPYEFIIYEGKEKEVKFEDIKEIYGYQYIQTNIDGETEINIQYLDSEPEKIFFEYIKSKIKEENNLKNIEIFAKNVPIQSQIYFEYWNNDRNDYAKAYVDFVIKFKNIKTTFYIEVKSIDDYNATKTNSIIEAFNKYREIDNIKETMILMIVVVDKKNKLNPIEYKHTTILSIENNLNNLNHKDNLTFEEIWNATLEYQKNKSN